MNVISFYNAKTPIINMQLVFIIIVIIIKQLVTQHMSVKSKLTNRSCGLATAVSDGKIC